MRKPPSLKMGDNKKFLDSVKKIRRIMPPPVKVKRDGRGKMRDKIDRKEIRNDHDR